MKKLLALTLGFVTLALIGTEVMVKTQTVILNTGYNQWSESALLTNFPNRQPTTEQSALALPDFDYNFEKLVNGTIFGQDQWVNQQVGDVLVSTGPGINQTKTAKGGGGPVATGAIRRLDQAFYYTTKDTNVVWGVWGYIPNSGGNMTALGGLSPCLFGPHQLGGQTKLTTFLVRQLPLTYLTGDPLLYDHWYEYRVSVDFSISGGSATLSYRDVTTGATAFTNDSVIHNVNLGLVPDGSGRYGFSDVLVRNEVGAYVDNLHFDAPAPGSACTPPPPNMVAWWPLDEQTGTTVNDVAGGHNGVSGPAPIGGGGPTSVGGYVGNSFRFPFNAKVAVPNAQALNFGTGNFTIDAWVKYASPSTLQTIVEKRDMSQSGYVLRIADQTLIAPGVLRLQLWIGNTVYMGPIVTAPVGTWFFVAAVRNGSTVTFYVNNNSSPVTIPTTWQASSTNPLWIGFSSGSGSSTSLAIDEVEIFNRALSQQEIQSIFNSGSAGKCSISQKKGMTWFHTASNATYGTITVGCGPAGPNRCDAANGDTLCTQQLPVLCIYKPTPAFQLPVGLPVPNQYNQWSGGVVATTQPVAGNMFAHISATPGSDANSYCQAQFGPGWRVAEFHDGWGWNFQAYGGTVSAPTVPSTRFWVHINDQPSANCWATP